MPASVYLSNEKIDAIRNQLKQLVASAVRQKGYVEVLVRDILPTSDLGVGTNEEWKFTGLVAGNNANAVSKTLPDDTAIAFYGVRFLSPTPKITAIRFKEGDAKIKMVFQLQAGYTEEEKEVIFEEPIFYEPTSSIKIDVISASAGDDSVMLLGVLAERKGKTAIGTK